MTKSDARARLIAGVVILSLPVTALYLLMQRRFVKGIAAGAIK